jgi:transcriptional regulator of aromatic amino acid metabolism
MRPNVLIEGDKAATEATLQRLLPHCVEPAVEWNDVLGDARPATIIVRDVGNLSVSEQHRLLRWLDAGERSQVLSTSNRPLFALVARGQFIADLFYRLNLLRLDV